MLNIYPKRLHIITAIFLLVSTLLLINISCIKDKKAQALKKMKQEAYEKTRQADVRGAITLYQKILKDFPQDAESFNNLGQLYASAGMISQAEKALKQACDLEPSQALYKANLGSLYYNAGQYQQAIKHFKEALKLDTSLYQAMVSLADVYRNMHRFEEAQKLLNQALQLEPDYNQTLFIQGFLYIDQGKPEKALTTWEKLYLKNPTNNPVVLQLSLLYHALNKVDKEQELLQKAIELNAQLPQIYLRYAFMKVAQGKAEEAIKTLKKATTLQRNDPIVYYLLAILQLDYSNSGKEAEEYLKQAFRLNRNLRTMYLDAMAYSAAKKAKFGIAENYFKQSDAQMKQAPPDSQAFHYYLYGRFLLSRNQTKEGKMALQKAKERGRASPWGAMANAELSKLPST